MSGPTKGMVAGQPIKTGVQSKEFDEGFDRTFGERKAERGRWVYTDGGKPIEGGPVDVNADWTDPGRDEGHKSEAEVYGNLQATDGTDISTKRRHREYMKANGLSMASDFTEYWREAEKKRAAIQSGDADTKERREIIGRALHAARNGRLKAPKLGVLDDE